MTLIAIIASVIALVLLVLVLGLVAKLKDERLTWERERRAWQAQAAGWERERSAMGQVITQQKTTIAQFVSAAQRTNHQGRTTRELRHGSLDGSRPWGDIR